MDYVKYSDVVVSGALATVVGTFIPTDLDEGVDSAAMFWVSDSATVYGLVSSVGVTNWVP